MCVSGLNSVVKTLYQTPAFSFAVTRHPGELWSRRLRVPYDWRDGLRRQSAGTPHSRLGGATHCGCLVIVFATADSKSRVPLRSEATNGLGVDVLGMPHEGANRVTYPVPVYRGRVHFDRTPLSSVAARA